MGGSIGGWTQAEAITFERTCNLTGQRPSTSPVDLNGCADSQRYKSYKESKILTKNQEKMFLQTLELQKDYYLHPSKLPESMKNCEKGFGIGVNMDKKGNVIFIADDKNFAKIGDKYQEMEKVDFKPTNPFFDFKKPGILGFINELFGK